MTDMSGPQIQIFGTKKSSATRAAERFFKERGVKVHFVDVAAKPMTKGELTRFVQKFGVNALLDMEGKAYERSNLAYLRTTEESVVAKMLDDPGLLRLPLVRGGKVLSVGEDKESWANMLAES